MPKVAIYNHEGQKVSEMELPKAMWEVAPKPSLIQQAVVAQASNARTVLAHTKTRAEVRGGGKKPWRQKGTGRARHGSIRSPLWRGGGITFGPRKDRNFSVGINKKAKRKALYMVLSDKLHSGNIIVLEDMKFPQPKTKLVKQMLKKLPLKGKTNLMVLCDDQKAYVQATKNLKHVDTLPTYSLNVYDVLRHENVIVSKEGLNEMHKMYLKA